MPNRLQYETSPYLRQHMDNPVNWQPYDETALQEAAERDVPIFLSIGYSTCHWCHVMAHESFEDDEVAGILNKHYVSIKVDREERPDIDSVYMDACHVMTGSGGWPLNVIMTPDGKPFFCGTYFPKNTGMGMPGIIDILKHASELWTNNRDEVLEVGNNMINVLNGIGAEQSDESIQVNDELLNNAVHSYRDNYDETYGGFGRSMKFPTPHNLLFLLEHGKKTGKSESLEMVYHTLTQIAKGGIHDHVGGGFSRYSTDKMWFAPHFEKMLYDNALLLLTYTKAYAYSKNKLFKDTAIRTANFIIRDMQNTDGGFFSGFDADSDGIEGKYYVFTKKEIVDVLGKEKAENFCRIYNITEEGNWIHGQNILNLLSSNAEANKHIPLPAESEELHKLYGYRILRSSLHMDDKILLTWNALTIIALCEAGLLFEKPEYIEVAKKTVAFIVSNLTNAESNKLYTSFCKQKTGNTGGLSEYATYSLALISLYKVTFDIKFLERAIEIAKLIPKNFRDEENGGFFDTGKEDSKLVIRPKDVQDNAIPCGNSVAALVFHELSLLTGDIYFSDAAKTQYEFLAKKAKLYPTALGFALYGMAKALGGHKEIVCSTAKEKTPDKLIEHLRQNADKNIYPLLKTPSTASTLARLAPFTESHPINRAEDKYFVCENGRCGSVLE